MAIRTGAAIIVLVVMLGLLVQSIVDQSYLLAAAWLCAGLACAACALDISCPWNGDGGTLFAGLALLAVIFGVSHVFGNSNLTKPGRQEAQFDLFMFFGHVQAGQYGPISPAAKALASQGLQRCGMQRFVDMNDAAMELQKAYYLGPGSSLVLGVYENWLSKRPETPTCLSTFIDFSYVEPKLAQSYLQSHQELEAHLPKR